MHRIESSSLPLLRFHVHYYVIMPSSNGNVFLTAGELGQGVSFGSAPRRVVLCSAREISRSFSRVYRRFDIINNSQAKCVLRCYLGHVIEFCSAIYITYRLLLQSSSFTEYFAASSIQIHVGYFIWPSVLATVKVNWTRLT